MRTPRLTIKGQKVGWAQFSEIPTPFPKIAWTLLQFVSLWNYPARLKLTTLYLESLAFWDGPHPVCGVFISLNRPSFSLPWLNLEFFLAWNPEPTLGGCPRDSPETWDVSLLLCPLSFLQHHPFFLDSSLLPTGHHFAQLLLELKNNQIWSLRYGT